MRKLKKIVTLGLAVGIMLTSASTVFGATWKQNQTGWWYELDNGSYVKDSWYHDGNAWYLFGQDGYMKTGWQMVNNTWYYLTGSGAMATGWIELADGWYYLNGDGSMAKNTYIGDYWVDASGRWQSSNDSDSGFNANASAYAIVDLVNQERAKGGVSGLTVNEELMESAMLRAEEVSRYFSHSRPDGSDYDSVITVSHNMSGENIVMHSYAISAEQYAADAMNSWMNSTGHRHNIMESGFNQIGVGVYMDEATGRVYAVQIFIRGR